MTRPAATDPFVDLADRSRLAEAARGRRRQRWLLQQALEGATLAGVLVDLAERGTRVSVATTSGRTHAGAVAGVGADVVVLRAAGGDVLVPLGAVAGIDAVPGWLLPLPTGDRPVPEGPGLLETLAALAAEGLRVAIGQPGPAWLTGELVAVGVDLVALRPAEAAPGGLCYVAVRAITEVAIEPGR